MRKANAIHQPDPVALADEIDARLRALPSLATDHVRGLRREYSRRLKACPPRTVLQLALRLLKRSDEANRFLAYELLLAHREALRSLGPRDVERLGRGLDSWAATDTFACYIAGPAWREGQIPDTLVERWACAADRWWRRAALVSTVALNSRARGGTGDTARTLQICRMLVGDRDDMVVKALSWALRELARRDAPSVRRFLQENDFALAARVKREVSNKLNTGLKNPPRREEIGH